MARPVRIEYQAVFTASYTAHPRVHHPQAPDPAGPSGCRRVDQRARPLSMGSPYVLASASILSPTGHVALSVPGYAGRLEDTE